MLLVVCALLSPFLNASLCTSARHCFFRSVTFVKGPYTHCWAFFWALYRPFTRVWRTDFSSCDADLTAPTHFSRQWRDDKKIGAIKTRIESSQNLEIWFWRKIDLDEQLNFLCQGVSRRRRKVFSKILTWNFNKVSRSISKVLLLTYIIPRL